MMKEFTEIQEIEDYLLHQLDEDKMKHFEVQLLVNSSLAEKTESQAGVYKLIRKFWRRQTRKQLDLIYLKLLKDASFSQHLK